MFCGKFPLKSSDLMIAFFHVATWLIYLLLDLYRFSWQWTTNHMIVRVSFKSCTLQYDRFISRCEILRAYFKVFYNAVNFYQPCTLLAKHNITWYKIIRYQGSSSLEFACDLLKYLHCNLNSYMFILLLIQFQPNGDIDNYDNMVIIMESRLSERWQPRWSPGMGSEVLRRSTGYNLCRYLQLLTSMVYCPHLLQGNRHHLSPDR